MILARRRFLQCLTGIIVAPAVVKADSLMRVFAPKQLTAQEIVDAAYTRIMNDEAFLEHLSKVYSNLIIYGRAEWSPFQLPGLARVIPDSITYLREPV